MNAWLRQHARAMAAGARRIGLLNALVIGVALALPAGGYALLESLRALAGRVQLEPQITLFLPADAKRAEAEALGARLRANAALAAVRFVPREEALRELSSVQGLSELIAALGRNPLPDAYIVVPRGKDAEALAAELGALPGVAHAQTDAAWARRLAALARLGNTVLWVLAVLLGAGLVAVTFNTVRLQILTQKDEIEVAKLLGATDAFVARPFQYLGLLQGVAGGALALVVVAAGLALLNREVAPLAASYGSAFRLGFPAPADAVAIVLAAGFLGWLGARLSLRRHLRELDPQR
ncbi:MAG: permease-like cell division protein FtsX [Betaproteobacteria bacterium]